MYVFLEEIMQEVEQSLLEVNTFALMDGTLTMQMLCAKCWGIQQGPIAYLAAGKLKTFSRNLPFN